MSDLLDMALVLTMRDWLLVSSVFVLGVLLGKSLDKKSGSL